MRRWGIAVTAFYCIVLVFLLIPLTGWLLSDGTETVTGIWLDTLGEMADPDAWLGWVFLTALAGAHFLLLGVTVDTTQRRPRNRAHVMKTITAVAVAVALLTVALLLSIAMAIGGDDALDIEWLMWLLFIAPWLIWGSVLYLYRERVSDRLESVIGWLIKGSVLELLVAVPCHVIVRQRDECSAPGVTALGIATGIAIMLMAIGPAVVFLYQKRLGEYR